MRRLCLVALTVLLLGSPFMRVGPAAAQTAPPPDALQAANELFALLSQDMLAQLVHQITAQVWPPIERQLTAKSVPADTIAELRKEFERIQREYLADVLKGAPEIYARHFTAQELRELLAFNKSPTGQKALHEMPQIMGEVTAMLIPRMQEVQVRTRDAFIKILKAHGIDLQI